MIDVQIISDPEAHAYIEFSSLMGDRKILKLSDVDNATGINRNTLTSMYYNRAVRIELQVADKLCKFFNCSMNELFEYTDEESDTESAWFDPSLQDPHGMDAC